MVSEMTYNVSSGTLNPTIPYHTHSDGSRMGRFCGVGVFVCLSVFPQDSLEADAARINKLDIELFHHESWKYIYFESKGQQ